MNLEPFQPFGLRELGSVLVGLGLLLIVLGAIFLWCPGLPFPRFGRLPGDIVYRGRHTTFYFPIVTCLVLSAILTLVLWLVSLFRR